MQLLSDFLILFPTASFPPKICGSQICSAYQTGRYKYGKNYKKQ